MKASTHAQPWLLPHAERHTATRSTLMLIFLGDLIVITIAAVTAHYFKFSSSGAQAASEWLTSFQAYKIHILLSVITMATVLYFKESYALQQLARYRYGALHMFSCALLWSLIFLSGSLFLNINPPISRLWVGMTGLLSGCGLAIWRYSLCRYLIGRNMLQTSRRTTLIVGWNNTVENIYQRSEASNHRGTFCPFRIRSLVILEDEGTGTNTKVPC
ncbi:hypothetical protein SH580_06630 [Coraliomargarita algicola]|uniref:Uncharacterized protein n=1 Tax=Coraliomargarita algicola TaxID=3092156 RepID=A0ABZ0RPQ5_9BACT|nr:hypothetical protein [Coraliomargarita sp. J2-16]WPJ97383.1 hypothetical protein SH580_06630 [Coraliomargarita sp. J2-16]